jgi:c-di-GMP-binding flagellar brake protein YcgR
MNDVVVAVPPSESFLSVGLPLKVSFTLSRQKVMYGATLLGWKEHSWLVCEWPLQLGHDQQIAGGTPCTISYLHEGKLVGYHSEIRDLIASPVPLLFVAYPSAVEEMHLRKHLRVSADEPILMMRPDLNSASHAALPTNHYVGGMLKDLSEEGCSVALARRPDWLRPGSSIQLEFELPGLGHITNLTGVVKNADEQYAGGTIGIQFQFNALEYIEYRGWGGSVRKAIEQWTLQKSGGLSPL